MEYKQRVNIHYVGHDGSSNISFTDDKLYVEIVDNNVIISNESKVIGAVRALSWTVEFEKVDEERLAEEVAFRAKWPELFGDKKP